MRSTGCADRRSWRYATPEERAADLHAAFADPDIKAAIRSIGGVWRRDGSGLFPGAARWPVARAALPGTSAERYSHAPCCGRSPWSCAGFRATGAG
ncbi:LD-carboxypeptidase [Streptomyces sp. NBC_00669]|uniref:LD-carboxypeptidase n=1 Tax=Streptomyces sp. NBC_00669 TaxID=2976011 RepID=UPI003FA6AB7C